MNVLEVQGLTKRYPAFTLNGVSFDVPQGRRCWGTLRRPLAA